MATITKADLERTVMHQQNVIARKDAQLKTLKAQFDSLKEYLNQTPDFSDEELDELMRLLFEGIVSAGHASEVGAMEWSTMLKLTLLRERNGEA